MRYWVFDNGRLAGPYDEDSLARIVRVTARTLVCPTDAPSGDVASWKRAGTLRELSVTLLRAKLDAQEAAGAAPVPPPDDAAALGHVHKRVASLSEGTSRLNHSLQDEERQIMDLLEKVAKEGRRLKSMDSQLGSCEERSTAVSRLREGLDQAEAAADALKGSVESKRPLIAALNEKLAALTEATEGQKAGGRELQWEIADIKAELRRLEGELERLRAAPTSGMPPPVSEPPTPPPPPPPEAPHRKKPPLPKARRPPPLPKLPGT